MSGEHPTELPALVMAAKLSELTAERDRLRADPHREREVKRVIDQAFNETLAERDRLREGHAVANNAADAAAEAVGAMAEKLTALLRENTRLRARVAWLRRAYTALNISRHGLADVLDMTQRHSLDADRRRGNAEAENARLRAVVEACAAEANAIAHETAGRLMSDRAAALSRWLREGAPFDPDALDVSGDMGGHEFADPRISHVGHGEPEVRTQRSRCPACNAEVDVWAWQDQLGVAYQPVKAPILRLVDDPHVTASGKVLTDGDIQALADEAERGYDVNQLAHSARMSVRLVEGGDDGGWVASIVGRPGLAGEGDSRRAAVVDLFAAMDAADDDPTDGYHRTLDPPGATP
jgi:hypothetical protein